MYSIPKYILDNLELLNIDSCNNVIDYHLNKCNKLLKQDITNEEIKQDIKNEEIKEDIKTVVHVDPQSGSHTVHEVIEDIKPVVLENKKKSFLDIVKNK